MNRRRIVPCATLSWRFSRLIPTAAVLLSLVVAGSPTWASWPTDGAPICTAPLIQISPVVAPDVTGGVFIAWLDRRTDFDIYLQHVLADGTIDPVWVAAGFATGRPVIDPLSPASSAVQNSPALASDESGGVFVVWRDERTDIGDIYVQHVLGSGAIAPGWPSDGEPVCTAANAQLEPQVVTDQQGGCIVVWRDARTDGGDIFAQRVKATGGLAWAPASGVPMCVQPGFQDMPQAISDGMKGVIAVWQDARIPTDRNIFAQRLDGSGVPQWTPDGVGVCTIAGNQGAPKLASDGGQGAVVAWVDQPGVVTKIFAQHLDGSSGNSTWTPLSAGVDIAPTLTFDAAPVLVTDKFGNAIVAFEDHSGADTDIRAQAVDVFGAVRWGSSGAAVCALAGVQDGPVIVSDGTGGALIAWRDLRNAATQPDIYGQHVRPPSGAVTLPANGISLCSAAGSQSGAAAATDGAGGAFVAWSDTRNVATDTDIYAQRFLGAGAPRLEAGFPVTLPADPVSPPAICELDDDPQSEIVLGTDDGFVRVFNHDGSVLWAQSIGPVGPAPFPWHCPIAVDDLDGDGHAEVFCGGRNELVHGFTHTGAPLPGWPVNLHTNDSTYVSTGNVMGDRRSQVIACSGGAVFVLRFDGTTAPGFPVLLGPSDIDASAAIGDVDGDGNNDIVVATSGGVISVIRGDGTHLTTRVVPGAIFKRSPALADLNSDGRLEIVAATTNGAVYVFNPDGTDFSGTWPFPAGGDPVSGVALANISGTSQPEVAFGIDHIPGGRVYTLSSDGTTLPGYPRSTLPSSFISGLQSEPIMDAINNGSPDVLIGDPAGQGWAWSNTGVNLPGWPLTLPGPCLVSPATGDIDQDGRVEAVFATAGLDGPPMLAVFDLGADIQRPPFGARTGWWPMFGYNPQRQHCLACGRDAVIAVGGTNPGARIELGVPYPNPTRGATQFVLNLPTAGFASVVVRDIAGRDIARPLESWLPAGERMVRWDGRGERSERAPSGVYCVQAEVRTSGGTFRLGRRVVLLR